MVSIKLKEKKEIENRLKNLRSNLSLIQSEEGKKRVIIEIETLEEFKDKPESIVRNAIKENNSERDRTLLWMLGLMQ